MTFNAKNGKLQVSPDDAQRAGNCFLYAIRKIKESSGKPLTPYKHDMRPIDDAEHAMHGILSGAESLGLDLGARWGNEIDSTNHT
jgi:hypothetical protein